jgi:hypothetical protein
MRFIEIPALITEDIEDPSIVDITEPITVSISGTTMTIDGGSKVSGEASVTLTGDVTVNAFTLQNVKQPSIHKISVKTNRKGNFTYVPNDTVTASSVSTTTKTGSDFEILLITTTGGETYVDFDMADYVSPALYTSNALTGFDISELTSTYGATAKLYKPDGTLLTTVTSATTGGGIGFGSGVESTPQDVTYTLEVEDDLGRTSRYDLPRKWISYAMETNSTPGFEKLALAGNEYTSTTIVPNLTSTSKVRVHKTGNHGYLGINFKIQGRNSTNGAWVDIDDTGENENDDESKEFLAFGDYLYHRVWVKPTAKATTTVSSSNVVTLTLSNLTEENVTTSFDNFDPYDINESTNTYVFEETTKIGTVPFTVTLGSETYTNAVSATTEGTAYDYVTLAFANPTLSLTTSNVTISSAKLYRDDVLFHTYGTESNVVLRSDQTGTYQAVVNDVYYSNRVTPDFTTTRSVSAPQLEFDGYNKLSLANYITITSDFPSIITFDVSSWDGASTTIWYVLDTTKSTDTSKFYETNAPTTDDVGNNGTQTGIEFRCESDGTTKVYANTDDNTGQPNTLNVNSTSYPSNYVDGVTITSGDVLYGVESSFTRFGFTVTSSMLFTRTVITPTSTTLGLPDGTTRDLTTQSNVYIYEPGTYTANVQTSETFAYLSNVVTSQPSQNPTDVGPTFTFDEYNRLAISNLTQTSSTLEYGSNTYDTNTASNVYVTDAGEYKLEASDANTFVMSNVYVGAVSQHPTDVVPTLTFDGYNKLTIDNVDTVETATIKKDGVAFATTTSNTVYIRDTGTYTAEVKGSNAYAIELSNVVTGSVVPDNGWIFDETTSIGLASEILGFSVSISGDLGIVGSRDDNVVYFIKRVGTTWFEDLKISESNRFGWSVGISGNYAVVGSSSSNTITIYKYNGTTWNQIFSQTHSSYADGVAIDGDNIITGRRYSESQSILSRVTDTSWTRTSLTENSYIGEYIGHIVAISGVYAMSGIPDYQSSKGGVAVYYWDGTSWDNTQILQSTGVAANDLFGSSVSIDGDYAVIGATGVGTGGKAYIFVRSGTSWSQQYILESTDTLSGDDFGWSVSISGDTVVVGSIYHDVNGVNNVGALYIYERNGTNWDFVTKKIDSTANQNTYLAWSVSISGDYILSGTHSQGNSVYPYGKGPVGPNITYDGKNKLTLNQLNYEDTTEVTYYSNTYNLGTAKTMYVKDIGDYVFKISGTDKYVESNVYVSSVDLAGAPTKPISFDGYNKLTLIDAGSNVSANVTYFSNTYELGSANVLYINGTGTYDLEMSGSNVFALSSNVVSGSINSGGIGPPISPIAQSGTDADGVSWTNLSWYYDESVTTSNNDGHWYYGESENNGVTINSGNDGIKFNYTNNTWHDANSSTRPYNLTYNTSNGLVEYHEQNNNLGNAYFTSPYFGKERPSLTFDGYNKLTLENFTTTESDTRTAKLTDPNGSTYALGQTQDTIYIHQQGDYFLEVTNSDQSAVVKTTIGAGQISEPPESYVPSNASTSIPTLITNIPFISGSWSSTLSAERHSDFDYDTRIVYRQKPWPNVSSTYNIMAYDYVTKRWYDEGSGNPSVITDTSTYVSGQTYTSQNPKKVYGWSGPTGLLFEIDNPYYVDYSPPSLTFDGYNKLSIENLTPTSTTLTDPNGSSFDIGTASNVYIEHAGTYKMATGDATTFALVSNVVSTTPTQLLEWSDTSQSVDALDTVSGDNFGISVGIDGNYAIVGAQQGDGGNGSAYIFYKSGGTWSEQAKLTASDKANNDVFGDDVDISGDYAIVASRQDDDPSNAGSVYIFKREGTTWTQKDRLRSDSPGQDDNFGDSVAISGDYAVVCSAYDDDANTNSGAIFVFNRNSDETWSRQVKLTPVSDSSATIGQEGALNINGDYLAFGNKRYNSSRGRVYVYKRTGTEWGDVVNIDNPSDQTTSYFGQKGIAMAGDYLAAGSTNISVDGVTEAGAVYVFKRTVNNWSSSSTFDNLIPVSGLGSYPGVVYWVYDSSQSDTNNLQFELWRVDTGALNTATNGIRFSKQSDGSTLLQVNVGDDTGTPSRISSTNSLPDTSSVTLTVTAGSEVYLWSSNLKAKLIIPDYCVHPFDIETWVLKASLSASDKSANAHFGSSMRMTTDTLVIGAQSVNSSRGQVYIFERTGEDWTEVKIITASDAASNHYFGHVADISGTDIIVGAYGNNKSYFFDKAYRGPELTYDTSNKLSITNLTPTSTTLTDPNGSSFDIGTASNVYIRDSGTYSIASKDANTFALASNTVTGTPTGTTYVYDSNTFTTPSQTYDTTKTITVSNVPSTQTGITGKIYKGSTAYPIHTTTSSSNVIIKNTGTYVSVFTTATQAFLTNAIGVTTQPTTTSDDTTIEDAAPIVTTTVVGEPLTYKAYLKTGINVNASTSWTAYDIFGSGYSEEINQGGFTLANSNLVAPETGYYRLSFNIYIVSVSGTGERTNVGVKPTVEGTDLNEISASNYIRVAYGHDEASTSMSTIIYLTGNKEVNLKFARLSTVGRNNQINPGSLVTLEKVTTSTLYKAYLKTGINVNASTSWTAYDIFGSGYSEEINQGGFTLANSNLVAPETGYYRLSFNVYVYSTGDRTNVGVKPTVEGTDLNEISASDYIRNYEGHNEASTNMSTIIYLTGNKEVNLKFARLIDTTTSVTIQSGSFITLEKI